MARKWSELSPRSRKLIVGAAVVEAGLKAAALIDLRRRAPEEVRGSKRIWAASMIINSAGLVPLAYFTLGRRRGAPTSE